MKSQHLTNGAILILIGVLFLLRNFGINITIPWLELFRLWPVFLVIAGLQLVFPRGPLALISPLLAITVVVLVIFGGTVIQPFSGEYKTEQYELSNKAGIITLENVPVAHTNLDFQNMTQDITVSYQEGFISNLAQYVEGDRTRFVIEGPKGRGNFRQVYNGMLLPPLEIAVNPEHDWEFRLDLGLISGTLNLASEAWHKIEVNSGLANLHITLPREPASDRLVEIDSGLSRFKLDLPRNTNIRINNDSLGFNNLKELGFVKSDQGYVLPQVDQNKPRVDIRFASGLGILHAQWID